LGVRPGAKWTRGIERKAAYIAALVPYAQASAALKELTGLEMSASEIDRIAQRHGGRLDAKQREQEAAFLEPQDPLRDTPEADIHCAKQVLEADATCVLTVPGEEHKSVYCGTAFDLDARGQSDAGRPQIAHRLYAASAENMQDFGRRLKALAWRGGMRAADQTAFIGDGARCLWNWAEENLPPGTVFIQDFWHVCEHLSTLAQALFPDDWSGHFFQWKNWLRTSQLDSLVTELEGLRIGRRGLARQALDSELGYLRSGWHRMDYARYESEGWPIGSGAIEGTCKHLIKARFNVTGAQWRRARIPQILALRLSIFNHEWEEDWGDESAA